MVNRIGQQFGNYRLTSLLGKGGFAEVYLGEHIHLKTLAAVKVLQTQLTNDDADKFRTEARTLAHLVNPHIIRVLEFGFEGDTPYLIMDYAPNGTLRKLHPKSSTIPLPTIIQYVKQIAEALFYAHNNGIVHRDVKPENMLLGRQNELLLSDFGIATMVQSTQVSQVYAQSIAGTASYMAPEQIGGKPRPASDQYALGVVVYEWLAGAPPFVGSFTEITTQHLLTSPPPLRKRVPGLPFSVEQVVMTALQKNPEQRFRSIQAFANALEQSYLSTQQSTRPIAGPGQPIRRADPLQAQPTPILPLPNTPEPAKDAYFNTLPALPKADVSEFWWPTFFVPVEEREAICSGMLPQEQLGITGQLLPVTSPLLPLPVSNTVSQPTTRTLRDIQIQQAPVRNLRTGNPSPAPTQGRQPIIARTSRTTSAPATSMPAVPSTPQITRSSTPPPAPPSTSLTTAWAGISFTMSIISAILLGSTFATGLISLTITWMTGVALGLAALAFLIGILTVQKSKALSAAKRLGGSSIVLSVIVALLAVARLIAPH
jgi:serine/threonine protein kinase